MSFCSYLKCCLKSSENRKISLELKCKPNFCNTKAHLSKKFDGNKSAGWKLKKSIFWRKNLKKFVFSIHRHLLPENGIFEKNPGLGHVFKVLIGQPTLFCVVRRLFVYLRTLVRFNIFDCRYFWRNTKMCRFFVGLFFISLLKTYL